MRMIRYSVPEKKEKGGHPAFRSKKFGTLYEENVQGGFMHDNAW
jgi:hypothetical protein